MSFSVSSLLSAGHVLMTSVRSLTPVSHRSPHAFPCLLPHLIRVVASLLTNYFRGYLPQIYSLDMLSVFCLCWKWICFPALLNPRFSMADWKSPCLQTLIWRNVVWRNVDFFYDSSYELSALLFCFFFFGNWIYKYYIWSAKNNTINSHTYDYLVVVTKYQTYGYLIILTNCHMVYTF